MNQVSPIINNPHILITSADEFEKKYSVKMNDEILSIVERTTDLVLAKLATPPEEKQCLGYSESHFYEGNYYFALSSKRYTSKYVYSFNLQSKSIDCIFGPSRNPTFFESRFIEFGTGFNMPGPQENNPIFRKGEGVISVYDLTKRPLKLEKKILVEGSGGCGWDGSIDKETKEISAFDHVKGITRTFPIFDNE